MKNFLLLWPALWMIFAAPQESPLPAQQRLQALFDREWEYRLEQDPVFASLLGERRHNQRWPDVSLEAIARRHRHQQAVLRELQAIDRDQFSEPDRLNYELFRQDYALDVEGHQFQGHLLPLDHQNGIQTAHLLADSLPFTSRRDYRDWLARLEAFPVYMDQTIALLQEGIQRGILHPRVIMARLPRQIEAQIVADPAESPFYKPFRTFPDTISGSEREELLGEAQHAIRRHVIPAFRRLQRFFQEAYLPACLPRAGIWQLPRGEEFYAHLTRLYTTTDLQPEAIHRIGLQEVQRIRTEMERVQARAGFEGSFTEFLSFLRSDPRFYFEDPQELLQAYRALAKRLDPALVKLFGKLPRLPYGVEPIPEDIAPDTTTAYYRPPAADGSRAGTFFVNLYKPEVRPKYEMEALSIHESVPGHHLQIALAMELDDLPAFRRFSLFTAFVEGWGLYAESLGEEMGFYQDPYSKFGQLTYEMWRAVRLVVDTGIHHLRWTRQQAIEFFKAQAAKTEYDIVNEVDRYIAWPGQALAYKIGELKIKELRARASTSLGDRFDVRAFHDTVLAAGAIPLDVLERRLETWIELRRRETGDR